MYPVQQIKDEGLGGDLVVGIEGLSKGNSPAMFKYKNGNLWGEALKAFLLS